MTDRTTAGLAGEFLATCCVCLYAVAMMWLLRDDGSLQRSEWISTDEFIEEVHERVTATREHIYRCRQFVQWVRVRTVPAAPGTTTH